MKIITGNSNLPLAESIAGHCFSDLVPADVQTFADGECSVEFKENIRGEDVFIIKNHLLKREFGLIPKLFPQL